MAWNAGQGWRVAHLPRLEIGVEEGTEWFQFHRIGGARRLRNDRIVVADGGSGELRFFNSDGSFVKVVGGRGSGPGEFHEFSSMRIWQASSPWFAVSDGGNGRINVFDSAGIYRAAVVFAATDQAPRSWPIGLFADGTWLAEAPLGGGRLEGVPGEVIQSAFTYLRFDSGGDLLASLFRTPSRPRFVHQVEGIVHYPFIPLTQERLALAHGDQLYLVTQARPELQMRTSNGDLRVLVRWTPQRHQLVREVWPRYKTAALQEISSEDQRRQYARYFERELPLPEYIPIAAALLAASDGNLWIEHYRLPWQRHRLWDVMLPNGRWLGEIETPAGFTIFQIGADFLLGRYRDSLGVERIREYDLLKP